MQLFDEQEPTYSSEAGKKRECEVKHLEITVLKSKMDRSQRELQRFCPGENR